MSRTASSFGSSIPAARIKLLFGIQKPPPDFDVVPPRWAARSKTSTDAPACTAVNAADKPAAPLPTTTTSASRFHTPSSLIVFIVTDDGRRSALPVPVDGSEASYHGFATIQPRAGRRAQPAQCPEGQEPRAGGKEHQMRALRALPARRR